MTSWLVGSVGRALHRFCRGHGFKSPPALEWHKNIPRQRTQGAKTVFSLFFSRNTYDKTIWVSSAISLLTQEVPVRRRDVILRL